jgi:hypothetical protein
MEELTLIEKMLTDGDEKVLMQLLENAKVRQSDILKGCTPNQIKVWLMYSVFGMKKTTIGNILFSHTQQPCRGASDTLKTAQRNIMKNIARDWPIEKLAHKHEYLERAIYNLYNR